MKKVLFIASMLCLPLAMTSCGEDKKEDKDKSSSGEVQDPTEVAEITCSCMEQALNGETDASNISDEEAQELKEAYMECLTPYKEKLKEIKINTNDLMDKVKEICPEASGVIEDLKNR